MLFLKGQAAWVTNDVFDCFDAQVNFVLSKKLKCLTLRSSHISFVFIFKALGIKSSEHEVFN